MNDEQDRTSEVNEALKPLSGNGLNAVHEDTLDQCGQELPETGLLSRREETL